MKMGLLGNMWGGIKRGAAAAGRGILAGAKAAGSGLLTGAKIAGHLAASNGGLLGTAAGTALGSLVGNPILGAKIGGLAGAGIAKLHGHFFGQSQATGPVSSAVSHFKGIYDGVKGGKGLSGVDWDKTLTHATNAFTAGREVYSKTRTTQPTANPASINSQPVSQPAPVRSTHNIRQRVF
jgi:hypothetical protein